MGQRLAELSRRSEGHGNARVLRKNSERPGEEYPVADWRIGRPGQIQQDEPDLRWSGRFLPESISRAQHPLRRAGTCHGCDRERHDFDETPGVQRNVLNFSDYMRPSMRLGALMDIPAIYIFTHDS